MADEEGKRCYLESSRDIPNMKIYEALGFHFVKEMMCREEVEGGVDGEGDRGCRLFCMVREPQEVAS